MNRPILITCRMLPDLNVEVDAPFGTITCILGPMFSGKTTELIRLHDRYQIAKKNCLLVKYAGDTRYDEHLIVTHQKNTAKGATLKARRLVEVRDRLFDPNTQVVAIDEGQFFDDLSATCEQLASAGKIVIVAALDGTFCRKPFPEVSQLLPYCDDIRKLSAVCMHCGENAPFTFRATQDKQVEIIGGADLYRALCRACYYSSTVQKATDRRHG